MIILKNILCGITYIITSNGQISIDIFLLPTHNLKSLGKYQQSNIAINKKINYI